MKTKTSTTNVSPRFSLRLALTLVVAAVFILSVAAQLTYATPGDLYESDTGSGHIYKFTPGGTQSTFASGLNTPEGLAVDSAGNLFEADFSSNHIYKFTPDGTQSTFASGLNGPYGLAFDSAGNLFEADGGSYQIYKFTPVGTRSTFASGLNVPTFLAFAPTPTPTPTPTPFPGGGNFVIGDRNAVVGNHVTFWGAQWANLNSLSGGPAPDSFKGFAESTSPNPPLCGGAWTSDPGNSSGPPSSLPPFITVIAASSITQSGSVISGNIPEMVIVQTDPGYGPDPGHAGTGTVVAVFCLSP